VSRRNSRAARSALVVFIAWCGAIGKRAEAAPQLSTTLVAGAAGNGDRSHLWTSTGFAGGLRGELLFGRSRDADFGIGPYVDALTTTGFSDAQFGGGATLLVPIHPYLPLTFSLGGYAAHADASGWQPGLAGELFWGSHSYNYESTYALSASLFAGARYGIGSSRNVALLVGARIDLEILALPFIFAYNAVRGSNPTR